MGRGILVVGVALILGGCREHKECRPNTVFVSFLLAPSVQEADRLRLQACLDGACGAPGELSHRPGAAPGSVELTFSSYAPGAVLELRAMPMLGERDLLAEPVSVTHTLDPTCTALDVSIDGPADGGGDRSDAGGEPADVRGE